MFQKAASLLPTHHILEFIDMIRDPPEEAYKELCTTLKLDWKIHRRSFSSILAAQQWTSLL